MAEPVEILLVEDNPHDVELTLLAFRRHNFSNAIHVARDGEEALDFMFGTGPFANRASIETPRVILLDLKLPKIDGLDVLRALKSDSRTKRTPVVVLTSSREGRDVQEAYDIGASSYIVKPVEFDKFLEAAKQLGLYWLLLNEAPPLPSDGERSKANSNEPRRHGENQIKFEMDPTHDA